MVLESKEHEGNLKDSGLDNEGKKFQHPSLVARILGWLKTTTLDLFWKFVVSQVTRLAHIMNIIGRQLKVTDITYVIYISCAGSSDPVRCIFKVGMALLWRPMQAKMAAWLILYFIARLSMLKAHWWMSISYESGWHKTFPYSQEQMRRCQ